MSASFASKEGNFPLLYKTWLVNKINAYEDFLWYETTLTKLKNIAVTKVMNTFDSYLKMIKINNKLSIEDLERACNDVINNTIEEYELAIRYYLSLLGPYEKIMEIFFLNNPDYIPNSTDYNHFEEVFHQYWKPSEELIELKNELEFLKRILIVDAKEERRV